MSGQDVHRALAIAIGAVGVGILSVSIGWGRFGRPGRLAVDRAIIVALVVMLVALASGAWLFATGLRPSDPLHFLYAAAALVVLPIARFGAAFARRRALALAIGAILLMGLVLRLAQTG